MTPERILQRSLQASLERELSKPSPNIPRWTRNVAHRLAPRLHTRDCHLNNVELALWKLSQAL